MLHQIKFSLFLLVVALIIGGGGSSNSKLFESLAEGNIEPIIEPITTISEQDINLYPNEEGVILKIGELQQPMDWIYSTPRQIMPVVQVNDYDLDDKEELAVVLHIGSGSGVAVEELHIVEFLDASGTTVQPFIDHNFESEKYMKLLRQSIGFNKIDKDGELFGQIRLEGQIYEVSMKDYQKEYGLKKIGDELGFGSIVHFGIENDILTFRAAIGFSIDGVAEPQYFGEITAVVSYTSGEFMLEQYRFTPNL